MADVSTIFKQLTGNGIITPMTRLGTNDFLSGSGAALIKSRISQVLGTRIGELPWRPDFGSKLDTFRHKATKDKEKRSIENEVRSCFSQWEPRIAVLAIAISTRGSHTYVKVTWQLRESSSAASTSLPPQTQEIAL